MHKWKIYSIFITIALILLIVGICVYLFVFKENITEQEAKIIAFEHANVSENDITLLSSNKDTEDRKYEIKFYDDDYEYEVDVNYNNGEIDTFEKDIRDDAVVNNNNTSNDDTANSNNSSVLNTNNATTNNDFNVTNAIGNSSNTINTTNNSSEYIGEEKAREIAVEYAGIGNYNDIRFNKVELDVDRNVTVYELEFYYNNTEYDFEINAQTGEVLKYEKGY